MSETTSRFVRRLTRRPHSDTVYNPYRSRRRANNLLCYLEAMVALGDCPLLLVGEAPGYKGCRQTGLPFSSGRLLSEAPHPFLQQLREQLWIPSQEAENTASMVWEALADYPGVPLFWNAFPFHPHPAGNPRGNRAPRRSEIEDGGRYLRHLVELFQPRAIAGVGRAGESCARMLFPEREIPYLRHPSYGGKREFLAGLGKLL
ncbi:uracil-DNA glycosylase [Marinobacteraceae bacterium S3BR75-40.1]